MIVPKGGGSGECREFEVTADPKDTGEKLKKKIEKLCCIPAEDLELFAKNSDKEDEKSKWIYEDADLKTQEVRDGAVISVGVHGMKGGDIEPDPDTGEVPTDAVGTSIAAKGDASYYHAHRQHCDVPEEVRIVSGGPPQKLSETDAPLPEPKSLKQQLEIDEEGEESKRPQKQIHAYSWGDEKEFIKIYVSFDMEPDAVGAAADGKGGQVEVKWLPKYLKMKIHGEKYDYVLELERIYYEIIPEECKFRVSQNKRVTLSLKKKEKFTWLKLLKPEN